MRFMNAFSETKSVSTLYLDILTFFIQKSCLQKRLYSDSSFLRTFKILATASSNEISLNF